MLDILKAAAYGLIQGLTEFLPVSSSGHLAISANIFGLEFEDAILFTLILHLGSLIAVFMIYRKDILELFVGFVVLAVKIFTGRFKYNKTSPGERFVIMIFLASLPLVIGALIEGGVESLSENTKLIGAFLMINSVILFCSDRIPTGKLTERTASPKNALFVGACQLIAVVPGISRSGSTITGGLLSGFDRKFAVKFSFIMSIPAILGASVFKIAGFASSESAANFDFVTFMMCFAGFICALVSGLAAIYVINIIARKKRFVVFAIYCFTAGLLTLIFG
ncbi:MAG: undecaprenyl-diphosphate phosphatase [Oscillospiraceae bacterium]|nr:undecaprenyl-diphosphate phosphatase [Oscillospiraceae bacterium]